MSDKEIKQKLLKYSVDFHEHLIESLKNPKKAAAYLQVALDEYEKDGDTEFFLLALRNVAQANGGMSELAKKTDLNRQNLYHTLSSKGNPSLKKLTAILTGLGLRLSISPVS